MKAVLVLDKMPDVCGNCFLFDVHYDTDMREICVPKYWHTNKNEKPEWCPLKELPERKTKCHDAVESGVFDYEWATTYWYETAWNECLDAITEGNNEEK